MHVLALSEADDIVIDYERIKEVSRLTYKVSSQMSYDQYHIGDRFKCKDTGNTVEILGFGTLNAYSNELRVIWDDGCHSGLDWIRSRCTPLD